MGPDWSTTAMSDPVFKAWHDRYGFTARMQPRMSRIIDFKTRAVLNEPPFDVTAATDTIDCVQPLPVVPVRPDKALADALNAVKLSAPITVPVTDGLPPLTQLERFNQLYQRSAATISTLVTLYKATGNYDLYAEKLMHRTMDNITAVCASCAGEK